MFPKVFRVKCNSKRTYCVDNTITIIFNVSLLPYTSLCCGLVGSSHIVIATFDLNPDSSQKNHWTIVHILLVWGQLLFLDFMRRGEHVEKALRDECARHKRQFILTLLHTARGASVRWIPICGSVVAGQRQRRGRRCHWGWIIMLTLFIYIFILSDVNV